MTALKKPIPFGKYYLLERINVGGMAEVFKAKTFGVEGFERLLAVKRILPNIAEDEEFITMFIDEAKIAVQLQHANIAQIFDLGKVEDSFFIALEYVNGRDLRAIFDRMRSRGESIPIPMACYVTMQVCEGLDYAHNKRDGQGRELHLVHRDISPQNVLIGYEGECKLIDFGIAKAAGKASKTQAGILKGKFGYMSPEQVRGLPIDHRSDIFAVGIVLYELLTGERLFIGESDFSTLEKVRNVEIMPPSSYNKKIPPELEKLVLKALARDPDDRYQNAIDLHDDLQSFLYSVGEFYSRKDLAAWMKKTFAVEIEDENTKIEHFQQVVSPVAEVSRRAAVGGGGARPSASPAANKPKTDMGWDDEELDTQIFDKDSEPKTIEADQMFFEDDDRTVANEPPPDILEQARPPDLVTPRPTPIALATPLPDDHDIEEISGAEITSTPPPAKRVAYPAVRPTVVGVPPAPAVPPPGAPSGTSPKWPAPGGRIPAPPSPLSNRTPGTPLRRSGFNLPPAVSPIPPPSTASVRMPALAQSRPGFNPNHTQPMHPSPYGTGGFEPPAAPRPQRKGGPAVFAAVVVAAMVGGGYWYWSSTNRPGRIELKTVPEDATVLIDNVKVGDHSPFHIERAPGPVTLSVTHEGYVRNDQNVQLQSGLPVALAVTLEPSPDTGFEFTSEPPGGLVWLDGSPINGAGGQQARTDFRALRIAPGHHVLEIKGESRFKPWKQEVTIEPGAITKIRATLIPAAGGAPAGKAEPPSGRSEQPMAAEPPATRHGSSSSGSSSSGASAGSSSGSGAIASSPRRRRSREPAAEDPTATPEPVAAGSSDEDGGGDCSITVNSVPWSEVWIDGRNTTKHTPVVDYKVPCGKHKLAFKRPDISIDHTESISLRPGDKFKQRYTLEAQE
jgi:serine/threonine protein kinase